MPILSVIAGNGSASMNIVMTGAMNDKSQATACETHIDSPVPAARRSIRTWAMSIIV